MLDLGFCINAHKLEESMFRLHLLLAVSVFCFPDAASSLGNDERPNIVFIFADDQCFETIHELGNAEIQTPNLDQLARE